MCKHILNGNCSKEKNFVCPFTKKDAFEPMNTMKECRDYEK